jgi:hypothetical protein
MEPDREEFDDRPQGTSFCTGLDVAEFVSLVQPRQQFQRFLVSGGHGEVAV